MKVSYICDDHRLFVPPRQSKWTCLDKGRWSFSKQPRCLHGLLFANHKNYLFGIVHSSFDTILIV